MTVLLLVPRPGLRVPDPLTCRPLPAEGAPRELSAYWRARLDEGAVIGQEWPAPARPAAPPGPPIVLRMEPAAAGASAHNA